MPVQEARNHRRLRAEEARHLQDILRYEIMCSGTYPDLLPDERQLSVSLGCSRNAVREALDLLRGEKLIERKQRVGTTVSERSALIGRGGRGLVHELETPRVRYKILDVIELPATSSIARVVHAHGQGLVMISRLTLADGEPVVLWDIYTRKEIGFALANAGETSDIFDALRETSRVNVSEVDMRIEAILADRSVVRILDIDVGAPLLRFERVIFEGSGRGVALSFGRARGDRYTYATQTLRLGTSAACDRQSSAPSDRADRAIRTEVTA